MRRRLSSIAIVLSLSFLLLSAATPAGAQPAGDGPLVLVPTARADLNRYVLEAVRSMPSGGRYDTTKVAFEQLCRSITVESDGLRINPALAQPSFCSSATYLVFLRVLDRAMRAGHCNITPETHQRLLVVPGQRDGVGIWGRWNANGPGTARLFSEFGLGRNFTDYESARPGDFMKIFWTSEIGKHESGHSVIYLGRNTIGGLEHIRFWSSNKASKPGDLSGYGEKIVLRTKIARVIFSRLERPDNIARVHASAPTDVFLASLLSRRVTMDEVSKMCGL